VEFRRRELEKFLRRVVDHPLLSTSSHLQLFLEAPESELQDAKVYQQPPGIASQVATFFGMKLQTSLAPPVETDAFFISKTKYISSLETHIENVANAYYSLLGKQSELSELHDKISAGSSGFANNEMESHEGLSDAFSQLSQIHHQLHSLSSELVTQSRVGFEEPMRDQSRQVIAAKAMLAFRFEKLGIYQESNMSFKAKKERAEKLKEAGAPVPPALLAEIQKAEKLAQTDKDTYEAISNTCRLELERFEREKSKELRAALSQLIQANINYEVRVVNLWKTYLAKITPD